MSRLSTQATNVDRDTLRVVRENQSLTRQVGEVLRKAILNGQFAPGQRLVERTLCELTGVSRTAVRESLRSLEAEGLVVNVPNRGPMVATISLEEAADIYTVRSLLEVKAFELFVARATKAQLSELGDTLKATEEALRKRDFELLNTLKHQFYAIVLNGCGSPIITRVLNQLYAKMAMLRRMTMSQENRTALALREMRQIYDAMKMRDVKATKKACLHHVEAAAAVALEALSKQEAEQKLRAASA